MIWGQTDTQLSYLHPHKQGPLDVPVAMATLTHPLPLQHLNKIWAIYRAATATLMPHTYMDVNTTTKAKI